MTVVSELYPTPVCHVAAQHNAVAQCYTASRTTTLTSIATNAVLALFCLKYNWTIME